MRNTFYNDRNYRRTVRNRVGFRESLDTLNRTQRLVRDFLVDKLNYSLEEATDFASDTNKCYVIEANDYKTLAKKHIKNIGGIKSALRYNIDEVENYVDDSDPIYFTFDYEGYGRYLAQFFIEIVDGVWLRDDWNIAY